LLQHGNDRLPRSLAMYLIGGILRGYNEAMREP
jgi:hypothetical protein